VVQPGATRLSEDDVVALVERRLPDAVVALVQFPQRPDDAVSVSLSARSPGERVRYALVYVNQYTGDVLGYRERRSGLSNASLDSLILGLHYMLLWNGWGQWVMGMAALVWLVTNVIGLALSWPAAWRRIGAWLPMLSARLGEGSYKANYDLHRAGALWFLPVLTVLAFTSVELNLPQYVRPLVAALSPLASSPPPGARVRPEDAVVTFGQADAAVRRLFPEARTNNIYRDLSGGRHSVYFHLPGDANPQGDNFAFVDVRTGEVTAARVPATSTAGERFMTWLYPLHTGAAFGWTGRLLVAAAGVVTIVLNLTGLYVWWVKWRMRRLSARRRRAVCDGGVVAQERAGLNSI
jgi:uncharacterized iron-regulated membrane protein